MNTKKIPKQLKVVASYAISPHMQRLEFTTDDIQYFAADSAGQYLKLMFTPSGGTDLSLLAPEQKPALRTYTIADIDVNQKRLAIDFVLHQHKADLSAELGGDQGAEPLAEQGGYGQHFAEQATIGDTISVRGPGAIAPINLDGDWLLCVADMTSLPALRVAIKTLPTQMRGYVIVELLAEADKGLLADWVLPENMQLLVWLRHETGSLAGKVMSLTWLAGKPTVWCACEFSDMKAIRRYVTDFQQGVHDDCYFSSYWKSGVTEDGHKLLKQQDKASLTQ